MADYLARLRALIGRPCPAETADYPIGEAMIHHWCDAMGDRNPVYTDGEGAAASSHGRVVAPPTMLQAWTMPGLRRRTRPPGGDMVSIFEEAGFIGVVATNSDQEYLRYLAVGDRVSETVRLESVSELKKTALGAGHFVTNLSEFRDAAGELVATMRFRMLFFRPASPPAASRGEGAASGHHRHPRPRPAITDDTRFFWEGARRGELLFQQCADCGALRHPPGPMCPDCQSLAWEAHRSSGRGVIYSYVRHFHPHIPPFEAGHPVALIELEEGVRLVADLVDAKDEEIAIGRAVEVVFNQVDDELILPQFRLTS
jgi:uncharacterized OB-fold protein/acyl dehydratase